MSAGEIEWKMDPKPNKPRRRSPAGSILLTVLIVIMAVSVITMGLLARSDMELECSRNLGVQLQQGFTEDSVLAYARAKVLSEYAPAWSGQVQLFDADPFSLRIIQQSRNLFTVNYCRPGGNFSNPDLTAVFQIPQTLVYWQKMPNDLPAEVTICGDVYCDDALTNRAAVKGNIYSRFSITNLGAIEGLQLPNHLSPPIAYPNLLYLSFENTYWIGTASYSPRSVLPGSYTNLICQPDPANPAGFFYCPGDLTLSGSCAVYGTLAVQGDLTLTGVGTRLEIRPQDSFPAAFRVNHIRTSLLVGNDLTLSGGSCVLEAQGAAQVGRRVDLQNQVGSRLFLTGVLYIGQDGIINTTGSSVILMKDGYYSSVIKP